MTSKRRTAKAARPPQPAPSPAAAPASSADADLARLGADVAARFPEPPAPPPPAGELPVPDPGDDIAEGLELIGEHPELLDGFGEEDFADVWELAFGLVADWRGPYWELQTHSKLRLGKWSYRVMRRHPELLAWLAKNAPDLVLGFILVIEIGRRVDLDRKAHRQLPATPPPPAPPPPPAAADQNGPGL